MRYYFVRFVSVDEGVFALNCGKVNKKYYCFLCCRYVD